MNDIRKLALAHLYVFISFWVLVWLNGRLTETEMVVICLPAASIAIILPFIDLLWVISGDQ